MRAVLWPVLILLVLFAAFTAWASRPAIPPIESPAASSFDAAEVVRGANLAALGNCNNCHTAPGGRAFAGGRAVPTPFGIIYSTNITPDLMTGIGQWSEEAFRRAMQEGIDRDGNHLYPAFPYDHFTKLSGADTRALYAYFMTRDAVRARPPDNVLPFPLTVREVVAAWKALYFRARRFQPDPAHDAMWNRGAYLVEGVSHCGACHTPRNALGAEKKAPPLAGGEVQGWSAYALDRSSPAPVAWNADSLFEYLRHGWHPEHGVARGPMSEVTMNLGKVEEQDVRAIATYVAWQMRGEGALALGSGMASSNKSEPNTSEANTREPNTTEPKTTEAASAANPAPQSGHRPTSAAISTPSDTPHQLGASIYASTCDPCHNGTRPLPYGGIDFRLSTAVHASTPRNIINVTFHGLHPPEGTRGAIMPGFPAIADDQLEALLIYMRAEFSNEPQWQNIGQDIEAARKAEHEEGDSWP
jgi:mono/diheme cytochrome c family protein